MSKDKVHINGEPVIAWSCTACGHIRGSLEAEEKCAHCGQHPAHWISATVNTAPADEAEPAVGQNVTNVPVEQTGYPEELFPLAPPGTEGVNVNPELRMRY